MMTSTILLSRHHTHNNYYSATHTHNHFMKKSVDN